MVTALVQILFSPSLLQPYEFVTALKT